MSDAQRADILFIIGYFYFADLIIIFPKALY